MGDIAKMVDSYNKKYPEDTRYTVVNTWRDEEHEVAWVKYEGIQIFGDSYSGYDLACECDFQFKEVELTDVNGVKRKVKSRTADKASCIHWNRVRESIQKEKRDESAEYWGSMETKEAILDIYSRFKEGEYFGQHYPALIYVQDVASLLGLKIRDVWKYCDELFAEEKLGLTGAILTNYISRFRFPKEVQALFSYMVESPLGWPNGDVGDGFLYELESAIHDNTSFKHGRDAFGAENYPNIAPHHLLFFGMMWVHSALARYEQNPKDNFDFDKTAEHLQEMAKIARKIHKAH